MTEFAYLFQLGWKLVREDAAGFTFARLLNGITLTMRIEDPE